MAISCLHKDQHHFCVIGCIIKIINTSSVSPHTADFPSLQAFCSISISILCFPLISSPLIVQFYKFSTSHLVFCLPFCNGSTSLSVIPLCYNSSLGFFEPECLLRFLFPINYTYSATYLFCSYPLFLYLHGWELWQHIKVC